MIPRGLGWLGGLFEEVSLERALRIMGEDTHSHADKPEVLPGPAPAVARGKARSRLCQEGKQHGGSRGRHTQRNWVKTFRENMKKYI